MGLSSGELEMSSDGSVLAASSQDGTLLNIYSLPSGIVSENFLYLSQSPPESLSEFTLSVSGKILGQVTTAGLEPSPVRISATCTRVPVTDGHTESVLALTSRPATIAAAREAMESFGREFVALGLPSSPRQFIVAHDDPYQG